MGIRFYLERAQFASVEKTPDVKQWLASIAFLILANFNWVLTRQMWGQVQPRAWPRPLHFQYEPHSTAAVTAFRFRFRHCLGSMRASMQGLGCVRHIYQQVAYIDLCQSEKREV